VQPVILVPTARVAVAEGVRQRGPAGMVLAAAGLASVWIAWVLLRRDEGLGTPAYDQAFFQQVVWNVGHGHGFTSSFGANSFLGLHFSPLLLVPAGLELFWTDPRMLTLINAFSIALAAPAAFLFLRAAFAPSRRGAYLAAGLAAALPFTPIMQEAARAGFHTEAMAVPAALLAGWAGLTRRPALMWVAAAVALLAKEDQVYTIAVIGLLVAVHGCSGMRRQGYLMVTIAVIWGVTVFAVIMPALRSGAQPDTANYYGWLGTGPVAVLAPLREPAAVWAQLSSPAGWTAAAVLIACCCGLPLLRPGWMILILPPLVANLLSRHYPQPALHLQYGLLLVVPAMVATGMGGRRALALTEHFRLGPAKPRAWLLRTATPALVLFAAPGLVLGAMLGMLPPSGHAQAVFAREAGLNRLLSITAVIPPDAPVAADDDVGAPLASRTELLILPRSCPDCYVVVDRVPSPESFMSPQDRRILLAQLPLHRRLLADDGRYQVWSPVDV